MRKNKPEKIKFSFIIPTLNEGKYIGRCIDSIRDQTKKNHEIIVVDSYSKDKTVSIARKKGCKILFERRKGPGVARNTGAKKAKGEILVFADSDTKFEKDFLEKLGKKFKNKTLGGCIFRQGLFDAKNMPFLKFWNYIIKTANDIGFTITNGVCFAYRNKYFNRAGGFNIKLLTNEDHDLARRVAKHARFRFFNDINVYTSARRAKRLGPIKFFRMHVKATMYYFLNHKSIPDYWQ